MAAMHSFEKAGHAGHTDRAAADHGFEEVERLAVGPAEQIGRGFGRRRLAGVESGDLAGRAVVPYEEGAAAKSGGLRLDKAKHGLHDNGRVGRAAAGPQHVKPSLRGDRIGSDHHPARGSNRGGETVARCLLGRDEVRRLLRGSRERDKGGQH